MEKMSQVITGIGSVSVRIAGDVSQLSFLSNLKSVLFEMSNLSHTSEVE